MGYHVCLTPHLVVMRTHCLAENVALISFEYLLVPECEQLPISLSLYVLTLVSFMATFSRFLHHTVSND